MNKTKPHPFSVIKVTLSTLCFIFFLMFLFFVIACDKINIFSGEYVATVNGAKIYLDEYQSRLNQKMPMLPKDLLLNQSNYKRLEDEVLDTMITEKIMYLRAQELNVSISASELNTKINEVMKDYGESFTNLLVQENIRYEDWKSDVKREMLFKKLMSMPTFGYLMTKPRIILMSTAIITGRNHASEPHR